MEKKNEEGETPPLDDEPEFPEEFKKSKFGTRKITAEMLQRYRGIRSEASADFNKLPELKYAVTKINQYGKRQPRTLKLSSVGIENIRKNGKVSSVHGYDEVKKVTMKNLKTFIIKYEGAKHDYQYRSPVAMHIVQEITSRLSLKRQIQRTPASLAGDIAQKHQEKLQLAGLLDRMPKKPSMREIPEVERKSYQAKKLQHLLGASEEQRLESAVDSITLDTSTTEGRTLKQFCSNFNVLEQNPATLVMNVRQFIDDLRAYIMEKHYKELSKLLVEASSKSFTPEDLSLSSVIERSLEKAIVTKFHARIVNCLKHPSKEEEMLLRRNVLKAQEKSQEFFGVKPHFVSDTNWADAVYELRLINEFDLPSQQLAAILAAAKAIYSAFNWEKNRGKIKEMRKSYFLTADDFFPIFIFVVVHSNVKRPHVVAEYLWNLCDPEQLNGEGGYYLTVFCSALEYLKHVFDENNENFDDIDLLSKENLSPPTASPSPTSESLGSGSGRRKPVTPGGSRISMAPFRNDSNDNIEKETTNNNSSNTNNKLLAQSPLSSSTSSWTPSEGSLTPGTGSFKLPYNSSSDCLSEGVTPPSTPRREREARNTQLKRTSSLPNCRSSGEYSDEILCHSSSEEECHMGRSESVGCYGDVSGFGARVNLVRTNSVMLLRNVAMGGVERLRRLRSGEVYRTQAKATSSVMKEFEARKDSLTITSTATVQQIGVDEHLAEEEEAVSWKSCKPQYSGDTSTEKETFL